MKTIFHLQSLWGCVYRPLNMKECMQMRVGIIIWRCVWRVVKHSKKQDWPRAALTLRAASQADPLSRAGSMAEAGLSWTRHCISKGDTRTSWCHSFLRTDFGFTPINTGPYPGKYYVNVPKRLIWFLSDFSQKGDTLQRLKDQHDYTSTVLFYYLGMYSLAP